MKGHVKALYILNPGGARKKVLVPAITDVLEAHPKE